VWVTVVTVSVSVLVLVLSACTSPHSIVQNRTVQNIVGLKAWQCQVRLGQEPWHRFRPTSHLKFLSIPFHFVQSSCTDFYSDVMHCTILYCTVLHCTALYYTSLHCTVLHCTALHCPVLHYTAPYCTILYRSFPPVLSCPFMLRYHNI
jgi:hypothetical protein